jgi:hypothetical protein
MIAHRHTLEEAPFPRYLAGYQSVANATIAVFAAGIAGTLDDLAAES